MGNSFFCQRCDIEKFQLSKDCADQLLNDDSENQTSAENRWKEKLKCLDDAHSKQYGLTVENFNKLFTDLQETMEVKKVTVYCRNRDLVSG
ncbi:hypothetical protein Zmor_012612 [Zophobas morio]|uniref:Uncharacterized protein n=1 Tax=Zophobas morio TaxID=2755281 RepID=A0AA38IDW3_9CUCU|nr:hypothetical protein Zmor_012612 [Zophobas morio]